MPLFALGTWSQLLSKFSLSLLPTGVMDVAVHCPRDTCPGPISKRLTPF
jgi:hypothetical protein